MRRFLLIFLSILLVITAIPAAIPTASAETTEIVTIELLTGKDNSAANLQALNKAFSSAREGVELTVRIASPDTYYVGGASAQAMLLSPHTVFDLNGAALMRAGSMGNMIQNCDYRRKRTAGGYELGEKITIMNGTLDGNGGSTAVTNLCNIGHASQVNFENMNLKNSYSHLIEFSGCQNCTVKNCTFTGLLDYTDDCIEALQFDTCEPGWNGVFTCDGTVCRNMTVTDSVFLDYPSGVGNHKGVYKNHSSDITIKNCTFKNTRRSTQCAIWCYAYDNTKITGNTIDGNYGSGIFLSGNRKATVSNNKVNVQGECIYATVANSYTDVENRRTSQEYSSGIDITGNTLYSDSYENALVLLTGTSANNVTKNTVTSAYGNGIYCSNAGVRNLCNNTVKNCGRNGIMLTSTGSATAIDSNTVTGCDEYGVRVNNDDIEMSFFNNTLSGNWYGPSLIYASIILPAPQINSVTCAYNGVSIKWGKVSGAVKYRVFFKNGSKWKTVGDSTDVSFTDSSAPSGTTRTYTVRCVTSDSKRFTSNYDVNGKSVYYVAAPRFKGIENVTTGSKLIWDAVPGAVSYRVFMKSNGSWRTICNTTGTVFVHPDLTAGASYCYTIRCMDADGKYISSYNSSGWSHTFIAPPAPPRLTNTSGGVRIDFTKPAGAAYFRIFRRVESGGWKKVADTTTASYVDATAVNGSTYIYTVRCIDKAGKQFVSEYSRTGTTITCIR